MITVTLNSTSFTPGDEVVATVQVDTPTAQTKTYRAVAGVDIGGQDHTDEQTFEVTFPPLTVGEVSVTIVYPVGGPGFQLTRDPADPNVFRGIVPPAE